MQGVNSGVDGIGIFGEADTGAAAGVKGTSASATGYGLLGIATTAGGIGIRAEAPSATGTALSTLGTIQINGTSGTTGLKFPDGSMQATAFPQQITRKFHISSGAIQGDGTGTGTADFATSQNRNRAAAIALGNNSTNVATTTFVVPSDYVNGQPFPKITLYWATDEGAAARQVDADLGFTQLASMTTTSSAVTFRYNFRQGAGADATAMESINPNQGQIVVQTMPEGSESFAGSPAWAAGDTIILSIGRNGVSGSDPNSGNMYIYGLEFSYTASR